jgi:hypothetical protein
MMDVFDEDAPTAQPKPPASACEYRAAAQRDYRALKD